MLGACSGRSLQRVRFLQTPNCQSNFCLTRYMQLRVLSLGTPQKIACALCFYCKRSISPTVKPNFKKNECNILAKHFNLRSMAVMSGALLSGRSHKSARDPVSSQFLCPRPAWFVCAPDQTRHSTQATNISNSPMSQNGDWWSC